MSELFPELIVDILMRLPVKSLLRFRCVSTTWRNLIDSEEFINRHIQHSISTKTNLHVILSDRRSDWPTDIYSLYFDEMFDKPLMTRLNKFNNLFTSTNEYEIVGSCNGLLCLSNSNGNHFELVLWNPFTRRYKKIPAARGDIKPRWRTCYGFGYDHLSNDYKVVRVIQVADRQCHLIGGEAKVYSLRLNSWKRVKDFPYMEYEFDKNGCFVNGALHWLVQPGSHKLKAQQSESSEIIVAFNLGFERFCMLPLPKDANRGFLDSANRFSDALGGMETPLRRCYFGLEVLEGSLCFCEIYRNFVELWVMKQYGVKESWSKLHVLILDGFSDAGCDHAKPLSYSKNGEKLLLEAANDAFSWYDLKTNEDMIHFLSDQVFVYFEAYMCLESLVLLGGDSKFDGTKQNGPRRRKRLMSEGSSSGQGI